MNSASNHQPVIMPVAQRGAQDDCQKFTVGAASSNTNNNNNNGNGNGNAAASSAKATGTKKNRRAKPTPEFEERFFAEAVPTSESEVKRNASEV